MDGGGHSRKCEMMLDSLVTAVLLLVVLFLGIIMGICIMALALAEGLKTRDLVKRNGKVQWKFHEYKNVQN